ncbi:MAG: ribbon-helix-helix protein, CopG family [Acidimicrobiales bacterium]
MRTTVSLDDDVAAEVERLRREDGLGLSAAINHLARSGAGRAKASQPYVHQSFPLGARVDVSNIGAVLDLLDEV